MDGVSFEADMRQEYFCLALTPVADLAAFPSALGVQSELQSGPPWTAIVIVEVYTLVNRAHTCRTTGKALGMESGLQRNFKIKCVHSQLVIKSACPKQS